MKYRRELTPNIKFQADRIFVRNDLSEQVIKSCKATNTEFLMFKKKLGICFFEKNYYEEEIIKIQDEEPIEEISKVSNKKSTKELSEESDNESNKESDNEPDNESNKKSTKKLTKKLIKKSDKKSTKKLTKELIKQSDKESNTELIETISSENDENTTNWYDKNEFNKILTTIDSNNFNHKNKIGKIKI